MARRVSFVRLVRLGGASSSLLLGLLGCSASADSDAPPPGGVDKIVYAVRAHTVVEGGEVIDIDVASGMGQVMDYGRYVPGARLEIRDLKRGTVHNVISDFPSADVSSVDVSFDATKVLFTMRRDASDRYHVYWSPVVPDGDGRFEITQLTAGPYDDQNAIFAAGDRIVFVTNQPYTEMGTRADEYNHGRVVTQLATMTLEGGDAERKLCSQNLSHTVTLFSMQDGRIGFSRWEHLENVNDVKLFAMNPDCTQMVALSGQHGKPGNSIVQVTESNTGNVFYAIATERENTIQAGALVELDARLVRSNGEIVEGVFDEEKKDAYELLTPGVPRDDGPSPVGRYRSPATLPNGEILVSWAEGPVNEFSELIKTPPDYGVYVFDVASRSNRLVVNYEDTWEIYAKPLAVRAEPPDISPRQAAVDATRPATLGSIDVRRTSLTLKHGESISGAQFDGVSVDEALEHAVKVRIIEGFSSEAAGQAMFGLTMAEGAALLGEAKVHADGSWLAHVPPYIPIHLQPIDEFDLAIRNQTTWIQAMPGEGRVCGGCHEDRSRPNAPSEQALTIAAGSAPEPFLVPVSERTEYPWAYATDPANPNVIQTLLDRKCVSCHNAEQNGGAAQEYYSVTMTDEVMGTSTEYRIPRLDLSSTPITVVYDGEMQPWPASYVSLFYPAALEMEMGMGAEVSGTVPPKWAIPSDARHSALVEKLNMASELDAARYAWPLGEAFSDPNVRGGVRTDHAALAGLTREEMKMLIRAIDMGGQFYARANTDFQPFNADPVAGRTY